MVLDNSASEYSQQYRFASIREDGRFQITQATGHQGFKPNSLDSMYDSDLTTMVVGAWVDDYGKMKPWFATYKGTTMEKINEYMFFESGNTQNIHFNGVTGGDTIDGYFWVLMQR